MNIFLDELPCKLLVILFKAIDITKEMYTTKKPKFIGRCESQDIRRPVEEFNISKAVAKKFVNKKCL